MQGQKPRAQMLEDRMPQQVMEFTERLLHHVFAGAAVLLHRAHSTHNKQPCMHMYLYLYTHIYIHMNIHMYVCMCACMYV